MREKLQEEQKQKIDEAIGELDKVKVEIEKEFEEKREKDQKMLDKKLVDKDEEIKELNALVSDLQVKLKEHRTTNTKNGDVIQNTQKSLQGKEKDLSEAK